jgi:hypothetical protein
MALPQPLRFAPPYAEKSSNPAGYGYWWQLFRLLFDLPDPNKFPRLGGFTENELPMLNRYIDVCEELAESTVLSHDGRITFTVTDGRETVEVDFPPKEAIRGTAVLFRQLASSEEEASYAKVRKVIGRRIHEARDERRDERDDYQRAWNRVHGRLHAGLVSAMADREAIRLQGGHESVPVVGEDVKPQELLLLFQYGDLIHWGKNASALRTLAGDDFAYNRAMFDYLTVVIQLSHFYLGYSLLVTRAIGR